MILSPFFFVRTYVVHLLKSNSNSQDSHKINSRLKRPLEDSYATLIDTLPLPITVTELSCSIVSTRETFAD